MEGKLLTIRSKKIGICLKDKRMKARKSSEDAASALGIPVEKYNAMELGDASPSFPQLETLALLYDVPFDSLIEWQYQDDSRSMVDLSVMNKLVSLREHVVAAYLTKARQDKQMDANSLCQKVGIPLEDLQRYEHAEKPIPYPLLKEIAAELELDLPMLHSPHLTSSKQEEKPTSPPQEFNELPAELVDFINKPINRPYLELAKKLSEMSVDKLRNIAESLLEITY